MNNLDPTIYNFKNLNKDDKKVIKAKYEILELINKEKEELKDDSIKQSLLNKFLYDITIEELELLQEKVTRNIIDLIVTFIDNYDHYVKEQNTNNYFYGLEVLDNEQTI